MVREEKNLCPDLPVPLDAATAVLVAALLLNLGLQGRLPTAPRSRANPDKSESANDFIPQEAKMWNGSRLQGAKYHRYARDMYVKRKTNRETSFRIFTILQTSYQFFFYLKGAGVEAVF